MTDHREATVDVTPICGRPVEAFAANGDTITVDLRCVRIGPPARAVHSPGTRFRVTARDTAPTGPHALFVQHDADSLWSALTAVRVDLEQRGWLLPIAAARVDTYGLYADRHLDSTVVNRFDQPDLTYGVLEDARRETVGTVADQRQAYQHWLACHGGQGSRP